MSTDGGRDPIATHSRRLSLAVHLRDAFTGNPLPARTLQTDAAEPLAADSFRRRASRSNRGRWTEDDSNGHRSSGGPVVRIRGRDAEPVVNPSGYLLYFEEDLPREGEVVLVVHGGERYADDEVSVDMETLDPRAPVVTVDLRPRPAYRFPPGATLLRGHVFVHTDGDLPEELSPATDGESGVAVRVDGLEPSAQTTRGGEFVVPVVDLAAADIAADGSVTPGGEAPELVVTHGDWGSGTVPVALSAGEATCYHLVFVGENEVRFRQCGDSVWQEPPP